MFLWSLVLHWISAGVCVPLKVNSWWSNVCPSLVTLVLEVKPSCCGLPVASSDIMKQYDSLTLSLVLFIYRETTSVWFLFLPLDYNYLWTKLFCDKLRSVSTSWVILIFGFHLLHVHFILFTVGFHWGSSTWSSLRIKGSQQLWFLTVDLCILSLRHGFLQVANWTKNWKHTFNKNKTKLNKAAHNSSLLTKPFCCATYTCGIPELTVVGSVSKQQEVCEFNPLIMCMFLSLCSSTEIWLSPKSQRAWNPQRASYTTLQQLKQLCGVGHRI